MGIQLSIEEARHLLANYHFTQSDMAGVFARLGTVQYDPLNPVGRNADLVLQARVPGYRIDDWQHAAYKQRLIYDAWDKQACLIPTKDWAFRAQERKYHPPYHDRTIMGSAPEIMETIYHEIDTRGPLSSQDFEDRGATIRDSNPWYGATQLKRMLRAMWANGMLLTHHRQHGRHYYDRPENVIPASYFNAAGHPDRESYYRWIVRRRHQAVGLLRPWADPCIWSACGTKEQRKLTLQQLVEAGQLIEVSVGSKSWQYHMPVEALPYLTQPPQEPRVIFLGPLDSMIWDRKAMQQIFSYDYLWEVYKPIAQRRWGYYVLPVFYRDRFIARLDSRLQDRTWQILRWWWEDDVKPDAAMLDAIRSAIVDFMHYLAADAVSYPKDGDPSLSNLIKNL